MPRKKKTNLCCPSCGTDKNLSLYLTTEATVSLPIEKGKPFAIFELLWEKPIEGREELLVYSDKNTLSRLVIDLGQIPVGISCKECNKIFDLPKGTKIRCNDAK